MPERNPSLKKPHLKYEGEWSNDKQNGYGILEWRDGDKYEGFFKDGEFSGKGTYYYNLQDSFIKYEGEWLNGNKNGYGVLEWRSGDKYEGFFKDDWRSGKGTYYYNSQEP